MKNLLASQGGFTLIEMVTIIVMIAILSAMIFANSQTGNRRQQMRDAAAGYASATKHAESLASSSQAIADPNQGGAKTSRKAYGVCITSSAIVDTPANPNRCRPPAAGQSADSYQIYARALEETSPTVEQSLASPPDEPEIIETHKLPKDYSFITPGVWIDYVPPTPTLFANGQTGFEQVIIAYKDLNVQNCTNNQDCRHIDIRPLAGAVYVQ